MMGIQWLDKQFAGGWWAWRGARPEGSSVGKRGKKAVRAEVSQSRLGAPRGHKQPPMVEAEVSRQESLAKSRGQGSELSPASRMTH